MNKWLDQYNNYSLQGYKRDSPDKSRSKNVIPSRNITMIGVDKPVYGIDANGNSQVMQPGNQYQFEQGPVTEYKMQQGGPSQSMRDNYENAMGWLQTNNYNVNDPALRHNPSIGNGYLNAYNKSNPTQQFNPADIPVMQQYFQNAPSNRVRTNDPRGFSPVDSFPADQTLNSRQMTYQTVNGNKTTNWGTNMEGAQKEASSWNQPLPTWNANSQGVDIDTGKQTQYDKYYQPIQEKQPQVANWHTGEDTDYSVDSVRKQEFAQYGGKWLNQYQQGGKIYPAIHLPDAIQEVVNKSQTAPMQSMEKYPHINRMATIQDSLENEAENHIDNKQYFNDKTIRLNNGNFRGANVDTDLLDDIVSSAKKKGIDPYTMLGIAGQETTLGSRGYNNIDQHQVMSGWSVANSYKPEYNTLFMADHRVPGVKVMRDNTGVGANITNADSVENYLKQHPQLVDQYRTTQGAKLPQGKVPLMDITADYIKRKGISGYNPGDPDYTNKVNKRINELKSDPSMQKFMKNKSQYGGWLNNY